MERAPFTCLGVLDGKYHYRVHATGQAVALTAAQHNKRRLLVLADLDFWRTAYPRLGYSKVSWDKAVSDLFEKQRDVGRYCPQG